MRAKVLSACALVLGIPVSAQNEQTRITAEDDLNCVIFVSSLVDSMGEDIDPNARLGLYASTSYFVGRYEAQRGPVTVEVINAQTAAFAQQDYSAISAGCIKRMDSLGTRLSAVGNATGI